MFPTRMMTFAAILWGLHGVPITLLQASPGCVAALRFALSCLLLIPVLLMLIARTKKVPGFNRRTIFSALFWSLNNLLFIWAIAHEGGSVIRTVSLAYCFPIFSIIFKWLKTRTLSATDWYCFYLLLFGIYFFLPNLSFLQMQSAILALLSGIALAIHLEFSEKADSSTSVVATIVIGQILGFLISAPLLGVSTLMVELRTFTSVQLVWLATLGVLTAVTYVVYSLAAPRLESTTTSTILLLEIVVSLLAGYYILGEHVDSSIILGAGTMMCALYIRILCVAKKDTVSSPSTKKFFHMKKLKKAAQD